MPARVERCRFENVAELDLPADVIVAIDIARPLEEQEGIIVEINSNPGLWLHLAPWADNPRPVGEEGPLAAFAPPVGLKLL